MLYINYISYVAGIAVW